MKTACVFMGRRVLSICFVTCFSFITNLSLAQSNQALTLDGLSGYADLGTINPPGNFSDGITIECWAKWNSFNNWSRLLDLGNGPGSDNILFANEAGSANLRFEVYQGAYTQGITSGINMETNRWYHVAATQDNSGFATIYIDGKLAVTGLIQKPFDVIRNNCFIGKSNWSGDGYFNGSIDEMRIWNVCRTQAEIRQNMFSSIASNATGLVGYYKFNEGSGSTVLNGGTNGWIGDATIWEGTWRISSPVQSSANAIRLDGVDDYISIGAPLEWGSSYTKEACVYVTNSTYVPNNILSSNQSPLWIDGGRLKAGNSGSMYEVEDADLFPTYTWVHVAVTFNAETYELNLYRDGIWVGSSFSGSDYQGDENFIGAWNNGWGIESFLGGKIDEVRIWNTVRTQAQIQANMKKELNTAAEPNLVSYYTFNQANAEGDNTDMVTVYDQKSFNHGTIFNMDLSGSASNFVQQQGTLTLLPVNFEMFTAQKQNDGIALLWNTKNEINCLAFDVQRSTDGRTWKTIATVAPSVNKGNLSQYFCLDPNPVEGKNYYRICERDIDGKTSYTKIVSILLSKTATAFDIRTNTITNGSLQVNVAQPLTLELFAQDGKLIWSKKLSVGQQVVSITGCAKGVYFLKGLNHTRKILVQ